MKKKKKIAKIIINNNNFDENKNQITEVFFKDISDNQKLFNNENMVKIFSMKIGENFSIGLDRLELSTLRLSSVHSNQLSYKPFYDS